MKLALETNMPYNIEVTTSCLEWLKNKNSEEISEFLRLFNLGKFELINPTYSQPYNLIIGPESNIKQFEYGFNVLKELGLNCKIYYCSECSLHPQIPQILKSFNIEQGSLRTRLLGNTPTNNSGNIDWIGLDGTVINALIDQSSVFNGEYWHGTFFREIPNLLFQAVARPFMKYIVYSSIEDFIMPQSYQDEIWRISKFSDIFGKFVSCSELFQLIERNGEFKYSRDDFSLGDYIFLPTELFLNNKICESSIISAEIINCILGLFNENSNDSFFDELWKNLLLTQAHDNYAVPFTQTGDYSAKQLSKEEYSKLEFKGEKISISKLSLKIQKEIQNKCKEFINEKLLRLADHLGKTSEYINSIILNFLVFNPSVFSRRDIVSIPLELQDPSNINLIDDEEVDFQYQNSTLNFIADVPPLGFRIYSLVKQSPSNSEKGQFFYEITILEDYKTIEITFQNKKICELSFQSIFDYELSLEDYYKDNIEEINLIKGKFNDNAFEIKITQYNKVNRLEFILNSNFIKEIILKPTLKIRKSFINYPFGIEETKKSNIQTLDFLWLKGEREGILFMQKNSQKFIINRENFEIRNFVISKSEIEFAIVKTGEDDLKSITNYVNSFQFRLLGIEINNKYEFEKRKYSFLTIDPPISLINLWRRNNNFYLRLFNPRNKQENITLNGPLNKNQLEEINLNYKVIKIIKDGKIKIEPWKIKTFVI